MATDEMLKAAVDDVLEEVQELPSSERAIAAREMIAFAVVALLVAAFLLKSRRQSDSAEAGAGSEDSPDGAPESPAA